MVASKRYYLLRYTPHPPEVQLNVCVFLLISDHAELTRKWSKSTMTARLYLNVIVMYNIYIYMFVWKCKIICICRFKYDMCNTVTAAKFCRITAHTSLLIAWLYENWLDYRKIDYVLLNEWCEIIDFLSDHYQFMIIILRLD